MRDETLGLPAGWTRATIAELADSPTRIAYGVLKPGPFTDRGRALIRVKDIEHDAVNSADLYRISEALHHEFRRTQLSGGEVLVSIQGTVGRAAIVPSRLAGANISRTLAMIPVMNREVAVWLWRSLQSPQAQDALRERIGGTTRDSLNLRDLREIRVPMAPIVEQRKILALLDSQLSRLDEAVSALERVTRNLERYRASVLKAAVEGRLVPTEAELAQAEGRDYEPAKAELKRLQSQRDARIAMRRRNSREIGSPDSGNLPLLPEGWCWATVAELTSLITKGTTPTSIGHAYSASGVRFVKVESILDTRIDHQACSCISEAADAALERSRLEAGDVLFSIAGTLGRVGIVHECDVPANTNQALAILRPVHADLSPYLAWALQAPGVSRVVSAERRGVGIFNLNLQQIASIAVPLPPAAERSRIVLAIETSLRAASQASNDLQLQLHRCERLRQSILKWAFEGRLVDQDPNDEPAADLLARIKAERATSESTRARRAPRGKKRS